MVFHKEFETAGKTPGLQIWRIENMDLIPLPKSLYGSFSPGDAYLLLYTNPGPFYYIHIWLGDMCTQDQSNSAANFATQLDEYLGGRPVQLLEAQNNESISFLGYFKSGVKYLSGGVPSVQSGGVPSDLVNRLLHVKGRRVVRATEVPMSWSSFNKGDCFILDLGKDIYVWMGSECNRVERVKAFELAIDIRDKERDRKAKLTIVEEGREPKEVLDVLGPKIPIAPATPDDVKVDAPGNKKASLFLVSDATGKLNTTIVAPSNPFEQEMLKPDDCYVLDNSVDGSVFVWKGANASRGEHSVALRVAQEFIREKNYSNKTLIQVMSAGCETPLFKQFFSNWKDPGSSKGSGSDVKIPETPQSKVDDIPGKVHIWRVEGAMRVPLDPAIYGQFYGADCYIILYSYEVGKQEKHIIYIWQGLKSTREEQDAATVLAGQLSITLGGAPVQGIITQGKEPPQLISFFKGQPMIIFMGGTSREGEEQTKAATTRLFHIRTSTSKATRAVEVAPSASNLNSNDVFVLKTPNSLFMWYGKGASVEEVTAASALFSSLGGTAIGVAEGKETAEFWAALGGKAEYQTSTSLKIRAVKPPRLFGCSNQSGRLTVEEVPGDLTQSDLATDDVMLLDTADQLFLWIGNNANPEERDGAPKSAQEYLDADPAGRKGIPIITIRQGAEPPTFTGWFQGWDPKMWSTDPLRIFVDTSKEL